MLVYWSINSHSTAPSRSHMPCGAGVSSWKDVRSFLKGKQWDHLCSCAARAQGLLRAMQLHTVVLCSGPTRRHMLQVWTAHQAKPGTLPLCLAHLHPPHIIQTCPQVEVLFGLDQDAEKAMLSVSSHIISRLLKHLMLCKCIPKNSCKAYKGS